MKNVFRLQSSLLTVLVAAVLLAGGCSAAADAPSENGGARPPEEGKHHPLNISLDGKVGWINESGNVVPIYGIKVTMIDGEGIRTDSTHTNYNGRFLIEHAAVAVGNSWEARHIYVEIMDDRSPEDKLEKPTYKYRRILKEINSAPNNEAFLTMDDIIVERIDSE